MGDSKEGVSNRGSIKNKPVRIGNFGNAIRFMWPIFTKNFTLDSFFFQSLYAEQLGSWNSSLGCHT